VPGARAEPPADPIGRPGAGAPAPGDLVRVGLPPPARLMHLLAYAPTGTRAVDHLILEFARCTRLVGWHITFGFTAAPPEAFAAQLAELGAGWFVFRHPLSWGATRALRRAFALRRPELLQTSYFSPFDPRILWLKASGFARRLVVLDHTSGAGPPPGGVLALARQARGWLAGRILDAVVAVSDYVARRDVERVFLPARKVYTIPNGIDPARFPVPERPERRPVIAYAGQLIPEKGVATLLEAAAVLKAGATGEVEVLIAGAGAQREELEAMASELGLAGARFLGHLGSVAALFGRADIVVVPSVWGEAFGYVAIEAMACGAAVVVSDAGALPEVVAGAGVVFRAGDAEDLAAKLRPLIESREERLRRGRAGRARVESEYRLSMRVFRHLSLCYSVLAR
jgi:glycosyltransferase involved in cell wall biosynthesis